MYFTPNNEYFYQLLQSGIETENKNQNIRLFVSSEVAITMQKFVRAIEEVQITRYCTISCQKLTLPVVMLPMLPTSRPCYDH